MEAGLHPSEDAIDQAVSVYVEKVKLNPPRRPIKAEQMEMWRGRFEALLRAGREAEVPGQRNLMYASFDPPFVPVDPILHDLLNHVLFDLELFADSIVEADYGLYWSSDDVGLLHRRALAKLHLADYRGARADLDTILALNPGLAANAEVAGLEGRYFRDLYQVSHDKVDLERAADAYKRAYDADRTQYYPGVNAASVLLSLGRIDDARRLFAEIRETCLGLKRHPIVSFWVDFTLGEASLGLGRVEDAFESYRAGLSRTPQASRRDCRSALDGAERIILASGLSEEVLEDLRQVLLS